MGLTSELYLMVDLELIVIGVAQGPPANLDIEVAPATGLGITSPGCSGDFGVAVLEPSAAGSYALTVRASNIDDIGGFTVQALPVTAALFAALCTGD